MYCGLTDRTLFDLNHSVPPVLHALHTDAPATNATNMIATSRTALLAVLLLLVLAVAAAKKRTVTFHQDPPQMDTVTNGNFKMYQWWATLRTVKDGPIIGRAYGQTSFNEALFVGAAIEARTRTLAFEFIGAPKDKVAPLGQVTANGVVSYANDSFFLEVGRPVTVPVTGGSLGWYGATGQVTSVRLNAQGEHTHTFEIITSNYKPSRKAPK